MIYAIVRKPLYHLCKEKKDEQLRIIKTEKAADKVYSLTYFVFSCIYGYVVLSKTEYLPRMLLGNNTTDLSSLWSDFPCNQKDYFQSVKTYYLITLGYHVNQIRMVFWAYAVGEAKNDWAEMTLHHFLTIGLYVFSYLLNFIKIGSVIMFLHDWCDIWSPFTKIWVETEYKKLTVIGAVMTWSLWIWTRLIVFP